MLKPEALATEEEMMDFGRLRLARVTVSHSVEFLPYVPKTGTGKAPKNVLRAKCAEVK